MQKLSTSDAWDLPLKFLKGVGENLSRIFIEADIRSFWDLLLFLPRTYEDRRKVYNYKEILEASLQSVLVSSVGQIIRYQRKGGGFGGRSLLEATVQVWGAKSSLDNLLVFTWFQDWGNSVEKRFPAGSKIFFRGKVQNFRARPQIVHPDLQLLENEVPWWEKGPWVPVYKEIGGLSTKHIRRILAQALDREEFKRIPEIIPLSLVKKYQFPTLQESLRELHFPKHWTPEAEPPIPEGRYYARLVFEELFHMALALHLRRAHLALNEIQSERKALSIQVATEDFLKIQKTLPYELTQGQKQVLDEIFQDLACSKTQAPMHRLLQGDVGSGKSIVSFLAAIFCMQQKAQVALMAPTEILANQHYLNFQKLFPEYAQDVVLLKGALPAKQKTQLREKLRQGQALLAIGTQALLTEDTEFQKLALVIVDEQHRFGVEQRLSLKKAKDQIMPHLLVMTATPIPRSLALTFYGDLNLSFLKEKPAGRKPIETFLIKDKARGQLVDRLQKFLEEERQIYIVYPLVEESEKLDLKNAKSAFENWKKVFSNIEVGLLHGKMKAKEKDSVMQDFKNGKIKVLVATTVIEVGVDVPNASVMVIENAERFGLSQLHQLRGRVGRGSQNSFCILMSPDFSSETVYARLKLMESSEDGFEIAEKDLEMRGPGEFLGRRQSGLSGFRVAHILRDQKWLELARDEAKAILEKDPKLNLPEHYELKMGLKRWWLAKLELSLSG